MCSTTIFSRLSIYVAMQTFLLCKVLFRMLQGKVGLEMYRVQKIPSFCTGFSFLDCFISMYLGFIFYGFFLFLYFIFRFGTFSWGSLAA